VIPAGPSGVTVTPSVGTYYNGIWTIPTLANGAHATLTITGTATAAMAGLTTNNTATRTSQEQYNSQPPTTTAGVYTKVADVDITQTVNGGSSATVNVNDTVTYIITAVNNGVDAATNLQITDLIPSGLTDLTYTITGAGTFNPSTGLWNIGVLNSGATTILTITGKVTAAMAGLTTTNYANRTSQTEYNPSPASTSTTVYTKLSDPIITQTVNGQSTGTVNVNVGDDVTFVVNAYCSGPDDATNIQIRDIIPAGLTNVTVTPSVGTYDSNTGIWTIPFLEKYTTATLTITGKAGTSMAGTSITNRATEIFQTEYNPYPGDSTSTTVYTKMADVTLTQTGNYQSNVVNFTVTATNNGPDTATNIKITDLIPSGLTGVTVTPNIGTYNSNTGIWTIPELLYNKFATLTITGTANPQSTITNTATITSQTEYNSALNLINNYNFYVPSADLQISNYIYNGPNLATPYGSAAVYTIIATNSATQTKDDATGVKVTIILPEGLQFISANPRQGTYDSETNTWTIGNLPSGGKAYLDLVLKVVGFSTTTIDITDTAIITGNEYDPDLSNNEKSYDTTVKAPADIQINNTADNNNPTQGSAVTFTVTLTNNGPITATGVKVTDKLPTGLSYQNHQVSWDGGNTWVNNDSSYNPTTGIWDLSTKNIANSTTYLLKITATATTTGTITSQAKKTSQSTTQLDYNIANNAQTTTIYVSEI